MALLCLDIFGFAVYILCPLWAGRLWAVSFSKCLIVSRCLAFAKVAWFHIFMFSDRFVFALHGDSASPQIKRIFFNKEVTPMNTIAKKRVGVIFGTLAFWFCCACCVPSSYFVCCCARNGEPERLLHIHRF